MLADLVALVKAFSDIKKNDPTRLSDNKYVYIIIDMFQMEIILSYIEIKKATKNNDYKVDEEHSLVVPGSWYYIIKSYDDPKSKDPDRIDDGIYSQFSVVMTLIYLMFGKDHPSHIAKYFRGLSSQDLSNYRRSSVLMNGNKMAVLLKKMKEDELVLMKEEKEIGKRGPPMKKYELNPKIIGSLIKYATPPDSIFSILEMPLERVKKALAIFENDNEDNRERNEFFSRNDVCQDVDYFKFYTYFRSKLFPYL